MGVQFELEKLTTTDTSTGAASRATAGRVVDRTVAVAVASGKTIAES